LALGEVYGPEPAEEPLPGTVTGMGIEVGITRLGHPDGISPSRMAEMLEVDKAEPKVRC
jgi:hypothetical protein